MIYEEGDIIKDIRDIYDNDTKNVYVEGNEGTKSKKFMKELVPRNVKFIKSSEENSIISEHNIEKELIKFLNLLLN